MSDEVKIKIVCPKCKHQAKATRTNSWDVYKMKCPKCGSQMDLLTR